VPARAGADGRLFGSVTSADVAAAVATQAGVELDRRKLHLDEPIRALGVHRVAVRLEADLELEIAVEVTPLR
jgi:large subunit ribosomal protein L9